MSDEPAHNPYESPQSTVVRPIKLYYLAPDPRISWRVAIPANCLLACAGLHLAPFLPMLLYFLIDFAQAARAGFRAVTLRGLLSDLQYHPQFLLLILTMPFVFFIFCGAYQMNQVRSLRMCRAAAVLACIPGLSPLGVLAIPFGIWATMVLYLPSTAAEFERVRLPISEADLARAATGPGGE